MFLIKVVCDAASRVLIVGSIMFTANYWEFSTQCYIEEEEIWSLRNLIGIRIFFSDLNLKKHYKNYVLQEYS